MAALIEPGREDQEASNARRIGQAGMLLLRFWVVQRFLIYGIARSSRLSGT